jgi:hypothetical protein
MHELILTVRVLMGLQECNHVLSRHFSFPLFLTLFLHGFKLGTANVIYYPELRTESRNTIELRSRVQKKYAGVP